MNRCCGPGTRRVRVCCRSLQILEGAIESSGRVRFRSADREAVGCAPHRLNSNKVRKHCEHDADCDQKNVVRYEIGIDHESDTTVQWNHRFLLSSVREKPSPMELKRTIQAIVNEFNSYTSGARLPNVAGYQQPKNAHGKVAKRISARLVGRSRRRLHTNMLLGGAQRM